jgi:hypothetical protein
MKQQGARAPAKSQEITLGNLPGRWTIGILLILVLIPTIFNAIMLLPELSVPIPSLNDDAFHYLFIQRANEALANGRNTFDHWLPELELGFPQFFYYQHLPHLAVIFIHRLLLKQVDLFTLFNVIRYILLVCFPITVFWSMRRMGFSTVTGATAAAFSTLLSSHYGYGLESGSYVWRGFGMYTQLCAMHLSFITLACSYTLLEKGKGYIAAVISLSILVLSHLVYAYMIGIGVMVLFLFGLNLENFRPRFIRLVILCMLVAIISSYFLVPFLIFKQYLGASTYLQQWKYESFGAVDILTRLVNGDLLDFSRFPVLTILLALGIASSLLTRAKLAKLTLTLFVVWLLLFFGRHTWGGLADLLPMGGGLLFHRYIGGVHIAAILLIGIGCDWLWKQLSPLPGGWQALIAGLIFLVLMIPALRERQQFLSLNKQWMEQTRQVLKGNRDADTILSSLRDLPPGRTYAGLRENWGKQLKIGNLNFYDLLTFNKIEAVSPPYQSLSLNSDLIWHFDDRNPSHFNLFNVRYVVAPRGLTMPAFLHPIKETSRYTLYKAETSGYAQFAMVTGFMKIESQSNLLSQNRGWLLSPSPAAGRFVRYTYPSKDGEYGTLPKPASPGNGRIIEERVMPERIDLKVQSQDEVTLVLKMTYHPNWRVTVDDQEVQTFMVSPSFIGFNLPGGNHRVSAEYRSPIYKTILLIIGACTFAASFCFRNWFSRLEISISKKT